MGVSGSGKSSVGSAVARRLGWAFQEGDALHPAANIAKMRSGLPLDNTDRAPWLASVAACIDGWRGRGESGVITCSALKRAYRDSIAGGRPEVQLIYLEGEGDLIGRRLAARQGHFMPAGLLDSQLATIEPPTLDEDAIAVAIDAPLDTVVERVVAALSHPATSVAALGSQALTCSAATDRP